MISETRPLANVSEVRPASAGEAEILIGSEQSIVIDLLLPSESRDRDPGKFPGSLPSIDDRIS